jgi:hypothetical protein
VWLPERETLEAVASRFQGLPIRGLDLHPVRLEDVYREVIGRAYIGPAMLLAHSASDVRRDLEVDRER